METSGICPTSTAWCGWKRVRIWVRNHSHTGAEDQNGKNLGKFSLEQSHERRDEMTAVVKRVQSCCEVGESALHVRGVRARRKGHQVQP